MSDEKNAHANANVEGQSCSDSFRTTFRHFNSVVHEIHADPSAGLSQVF